MFNVEYHWDKLKTCVVGNTYPGEFYNFIDNAKIRSVMTQVAEDTLEDLQYLCTVLENFNVKVIRPEISKDFDSYKIGEHYLPAPITPRDDMAMVGSTFYMTRPNLYAKWNQLKGTDWPALPPKNQEEFANLPKWILNELAMFGVDNLIDVYQKDFGCYKNIETFIKTKGNPIVYDQNIDSAMICRLGQDLYVGTWQAGQDSVEIRKRMSQLFPSHNVHVVDSAGHLDGTICPVCPGLLIVSPDIEQEPLKTIFPNWEIYCVGKFIPNSKFNKLKKQNNGKWWIPGHEDDAELTRYIETNFNNWLGYVEETAIDVNMLIIDSQNILCSQENESLFKKLQEYKITPHVVPLRHKNFWDGGLHCLTNDLDRAAGNA